MRIAAILTALIGLVCATANSAWASDEDAIKAINALGGSVRAVSADTSLRDVDFHLSGTDLTDAGLVHLANVENLAWLHLKDTQITGAGLRHLAGLKGLKRLHLERTKVSDAGLAHLAGLENLEYLNLYGTDISDAGLAHLKGLKNLRKLYVWQTKVTGQGVADLQAALPELLVIGIPGDNPIDKFAAENAPPEKTLTKGQYVRVRLTGYDRIINLAEVQVIQTGNGQPLQRNGKAQQSSTHFNALASRASDGDTSQVFKNGSVSHTLLEDNPFWMIDLGGVKDIGRIRIFNRKDCCGDRMKGAIVEVLDGDMKVVWAKTLKDAANGSVHDYIIK